MKKILFPILICFSVMLFAQEELSVNESFISPVKHQIRLSGSFGELRRNHFHTGIDIKGTAHPAGDSLFSVMSGTISRIRVQAGSYGQSIFIDHPNGMTSVYAHLDEFRPDISRKVKAIQRKTESFEIDYYPSKSEITLNQGEFIGYLGNTGRSSGRHLHFELRDTKTELSLNPLYFDFGISDRKAPFISKVLVHELDSNFQVLDKAFLNTSQSVYECSSELIGIGFKGYDQMDGSANYNGIAEIKMYLENRLIYEMVFDTISFDEFRYINASVDYEQYAKHNDWYYICYKLPNNRLNNLKKIKNDGLITLKDTSNVKIVVKDLSGNRSVKEINLILKKGTKPTKSKNIAAISAIHKSSGKAKINLPAKSIYKPQDIFFNYDSINYELRIGKSYIPCHGYYNLTISNIPNNPKLKLFFINRSNKLVNVGGYMQNDTFHCKINRFGQFILKEDNSSPTISFAQKTTRKLLFKVRDAHSTSGMAEDLFIHCSVDGKFVPFYYKSMDNVLSIDKRDVNGRQLTIRAYDNAGNENFLKYTLNR